MYTRCGKFNSEGIKGSGSGECSTARVLRDFDVMVQGTRSEVWKCGAESAR